jgi:hypothetical protein
MLKRVALAASLLASLAVPATALAGNGAGPNKSGSSSISAPVVVSSATVSAASTISSPHYGDTITFNVSTTATATAYVNLKCYQGGAVVGEGWAAFFAAGTPGVFGLYSGPWSGGAADCTADLGMFANNGKWKVLASTSFHVDA